MRLSTCDPYDIRTGEEGVSFMLSSSLGRTRRLSRRSGKIVVSERFESCSGAGDEREIDDEV